MKDSVADALLSLKEAYAEAFPHSNPDTIRFSDTQIAQVVLLRKGLAMFEKRMKWRQTADPE